MRKKGRNFAPGKTKMKQTTMAPSLTISRCTALQAASVITNYLSEEKTLCVKIKDAMARAESRPFFLLLREDGHHVLVCQDAGMADAELADEDRFNGDDPLYFSENYLRVSPVHYLLKCKERITNDTHGKTYSILPVLLTGCRIINLEDMEEVWEKMGITVHTQQRGASPFSNMDIPTVAYQDLACLLDCYRKACDEGKDVQEALLKIEHKMENRKYKVYCKAGEETMPIPHPVKNDREEESASPVKEEVETPASGDEDYDDDDDFDFFEMPEMPQGIDNAPSVEMLSPIDDPQSLLDSMVGMEKIKKDIRNILIMSRYNDLLRKNNSSAMTHELSQHALFLGGPGTGKTTLARIYGSLLKKAGMLSKGHTVVCTRASFLGTRWGDEEAKTNIILGLAKGGVLFIDEAYLLNTSNPSDPGKNVLQLMLPILADEEQRDIAIVLAGYTKPMQELIDTNQGLSSRFTNRFEFQDLSFKELQDVSRLYIRKYNYHFTPTAWKEYCNRLRQSLETKTQEWGNARFVHNTIDHMFQMHAMRCVQRGVNGKQLLSLTYEDVRNTPFPEKKTDDKRIIGFR